MSNDLRDRLRRLGKLGAHTGAPKGVTPLKPAPIAPHPSSVVRRPSPTENLWNLELPTPFGPAFIRRTRYPLDHRHGDRPLGLALMLPPSAFQDAPEFDARDALFLDTETTGLSGGAGTLAFLVGAGYFDKDEGRRMKDEHDEDSSFILPPSSFVVDQFFLPDPAYEPGLLWALDQLVGRHASLVTFNGRGFDVPLLETRFALSRIPPSLSDKAHLDLLLSSRRLWRYALTSRSLSSIEYHLLDVRRDHQDIAGFLIPELYREYLHTGDTTEMERVLYHNLCDVLSMVTLAPHIASTLAEPSTPSEHLSIAVYYERHGDVERAEASYRAVLNDGASELHYGIALRRLARCLKRQNRRADALSFWQQLADQGDYGALIEVAKHHEWQDGDLQAALSLCRRALDRCDQPAVRADIERRAARLERKLNRAQTADSKSRRSRSDQRNL